ncbi:MAG TPA: transcription termination factor NusA [Candidatus Saccharicenans sp.]|jgi:N utilization substance protein A|nr:transcription termination factor NusA [Candidatus Saccharicenans sp.]HRD02407.1 transcription termination factor NusA [Candidatus Saccharicenans sp.]
MKVNVWNTINQLSKERGVEPRVIIKAIEESLRIAAARFFNQGEDIQVDFKPEKSELRVYALKKVVPEVTDPAKEISLDEALLHNPEARLEETIEIELPADTLGRIAAQAAKQAIFQKVRDAEVEKVYEEFAPRVGEIVTGVARRYENNGTVVEISRTDAFLSDKDRLPGDEFRPGDLVKALISQVQKNPRGPQILLSRTSPRFLSRLLELEVPEIAAGTIKVKDIARQPGERAKVAVYSEDRDIDPVGACIGVKGNRILSILKELDGEKIDIIEWSSDPVLYAKAALSPAKINRVVITSKEAKEMEARVDNEQFSLAIGKKGMNVRLASKLVGWKISIKQE